MLSINQSETDARYLLYNQDGMLDVFIGLGIIAAGFFIRTELVWMLAILIPALLPAWQLFRKRFLQQRIGELDFDPQKQARSQRLLLYITLLFGVLVLAGVGVFFAFEAGDGTSNNWARDYFLVISGGVFGILWFVAAILLRVKRYFLYGVLCAAGLATSQFTGIGFPLALILIGSAISLIGTLILIRFIQEHPVIIE